jgi:hypothetical protein
MTKGGPASEPPFDTNGRTTAWRDAAKQASLPAHSGSTSGVGVPATQVTVIR